MAGHRAIAVACEGVVRLLEAAAAVEDFNNELGFQVYSAKDFAQPMAAGVSLFLYRVHLNGSPRLPAGRLGPDGLWHRVPVPLDLHLLLTIWGKEASLQHAIAGWTMQTLNDTPVLPAGLLNSLAADVFGPDETVDVVPGELGNEELLRIWETVAPNTAYQLSIPYVVRNVRIESPLRLSLGEPVQERAFDYRVPARGTP